MLGVLLSIGSAICTAITSVCTTLAVACSVATSFVSVLKSLVDVESNLEPEQFGEKVLCAEQDGITLESYKGNYADYLADIKKIDVDKYDTEKFTEIEKNIKATETAANIILLVSGSDAQHILVNAIKHPDVFNSEFVLRFLDANKNGILPADDLGRYLTNNIPNFKEEKEIMDKIIYVAAEGDTNFNENDFRYKLEQIRD